MLPSASVSDTLTEIIHGQLGGIAVKNHGGLYFIPDANIGRRMDVIMVVEAAAVRQLGLVETRPFSDPDEADGVNRVRPREYFGLKLFAFDDVVQHLDRCRAVFTDLAGWPLLRSVRLTNLTSDLCDGSGPVQFDFRRNDFRRRRRKRRGNSDRAKAKRRQVA